MRRIATTIIVALSAAGCGVASHTRHVAQQSKTVAFTRCLRSHGVTKYPDPGGNGVIPKVSLQQLGVSLATFQSAQGACRQFLPNGGQPPDQAQIDHVREVSVEFARCVRAHGVHGFPDPGSDGRIPDPSSAGIDQGSRVFQAANNACARYRPPYMPSNAAYDQWARTHGG
jgi:hypothetical protein